MSPEAQRIAIAEACGWEHIAFNRGWIKVGDGETQCVIPDYLNDLNAMHEAEVFIRKDHDVYGLYLSHLNRTAPECRVHATPAQKAEAFLRAIGKWETAK